MSIVCMRCGGVSVPLCMGEFGESQMGAPHLKPTLNRREGLKCLAERGVCLRQRITSLGDLA
jgi:hypothetical protein